MMKKSSEEDLVVFIFCVVTLMVMALGIFIGYGIATKVEQSDWERKAIQHNAAQYNPTTGKFEWLDNECR